jgi:CDP-alcohol phosphatidyltransferase
MECWVHLWNKVGQSGGEELFADDGTEETERHHLSPNFPPLLPCLRNSQLIVAKAALSRLSTQSMPLIWPLSNRTQKMYFSSCLTSLVSGTLRRETIIALLKGYPGYSRIILAGLALHYMSYHPKYCTLLYCISCLLDAVDGQAARALDQTSKFGAVLDMVTDRYGTRQ